MDFCKTFSIITFKYCKYFLRNNNNNILSLLLFDKVVIREYKGKFNLIN
jgi:hypothetical protein